MARVRPILADELQAFVAAATDPERVEPVGQYVRDLLAQGATRTDWCYLAEREGRPVGRVALWTLPKHSRPLALVLLDLPWQREDALEIGAALLEETSRAAFSLGAEELLHVVDSPAQWPQWQGHQERREAVLERQGFNLRRETFRFELGAADARPRSSGGQGLTFRSLNEAGDRAFLEAIERVSEGSLDRYTQAERARLGPAVEAEHTLEHLRAIDHDPAWWELACTSGGALVGLIMPCRAPSASTIGYVGIVPEMRGRGYGEALLVRGTDTLLAAGAAVIRADTDVGNAPMANAFRRAGYRELGRRREYLRRSQG